MKRKIKVAILYRVVQHWRAPMFKRISDIENIDLKVFYGSDFEGTKVVSGKNLNSFKNKKLPTIKITKKLGGAGSRQMPVCPTLFWELIKFSPDVILTEGASNFANAVQGFVYSKMFGKKIIWWGLGRLQNEMGNTRKDRFINYFEKRCDAHIVYSSIGERYYTSIGYPQEKIFTAVNVVDTDRIHEIVQKLEFKELKHSQNGFNVLYVGALTKVKKVDMLMKAFASLERKYDDLVLNIIGNGPEKENLEKLSGTLNSKNIFFRGQVIEGLDRYFATSDVFVLPGLGGLAISEAMAYGLPVIASMGDGCEVNLVDETNGVVDVNLNEKSLAGYLEDLYNNREKLEKLKRSSLEKIEKKYNVNTYINEIHRAIQFVTKN